MRLWAGRFDYNRMRWCAGAARALPLPLSPIEVRNVVVYCAIIARILRHRAMPPLIALIRRIYTFHGMYELQILIRYFRQYKISECKECFSRALIYFINTLSVIIRLTSPMLFIYITHTDNKADYMIELFSLPAFSRLSFRANNISQDANTWACK